MFKTIFAVLLLKLKKKYKLKENSFIMEILQAPDNFAFHYYCNEFDDNWVSYFYGNIPDSFNLLRSTPHLFWKMICRFSELNSHLVPKLFSFCDIVDSVLILKKKHIRMA